jgi:hypothetical protein
MHRQQPFLAAQLHGLLAIRTATSPYQPTDPDVVATACLSAASFAHGSGCSPSRSASACTDRLSGRRPGRRGTAPRRRSSSGWVASSGVGNQLPLGLGSVSTLDPAGLVTLVTLLAILVAALGALRAAGDRPRPRARLGGVVFAVQLHHYPGTQGRVVLGAAHPRGQLLTRPRPDRELAVVERHKHRVQAGGGWLATALTGDLDRALADRLGAAHRHARPWRTNALRSDGQVVPGSAAAAFTEPRRSASCKARSAWARSARKRLGCQLTRCWACKASLVGVGEDSTTWAVG